MNREYVEALQRPNNNQSETRKEAKDLVAEKTFSRDLLEYAIDNFLEAVQAYYDDFDPQKLYYIVEMRGEKIACCFDIENLAHLLGLANYRYLREAAIINNLLSERRELSIINSRNWLSIFNSLFQEKRTEIINYDSNPNNEHQKKLNWDKISEKVFCFLNIGILSEKQNTPTIYYRENVAKGKEKYYVIAKDVITKEISGQIRMQMIAEYITYSNGKREKVLTPVSIIFVENPERKAIINMNGIDFRFEGKLTITQVLGGNYGK